MRSYFRRRRNRSGDKRDWFLVLRALHYDYVNYGVLNDRLSLLRFLTEIEMAIF